MTRRGLLLIANASAGGKPGSGEKRERLRPGDLRRELVARGLQVELHELAEGDDITALATGAADTMDVVVAGGDGTVGPAAIGLLNGTATLGILPLGSFNNLARGAGLPLDVGAAIEIIARGATGEIDAGVAWSLTPETAKDTLDEPPDDATVFFEAVGIGLDAVGFDVAEASRNGIGPALQAARLFLARSARPMRLSVDGREYRIRTPAITVCNGPFHGLGFALAPDALPDDGLLDVVLFRRMGSVGVLRHFLAVARGGRRHEPRVEILRCRQAVIGIGASPLPAHADGSAIGTTPIAVTVLPGALRLFR